MYLVRITDAKNPLNECADDPNFLFAFISYLYMKYFLISMCVNMYLDVHLFIFEENMYSESACGFTVAILVLMTLHLNYFIKRYVLNVFHLHFVMFHMYMECFCFVLQGIGMLR